MNKKLTLSSEFIYVFSVILLALAVAMVTAANFGVSMIVAPAYVFSRKFTFFTFGQAEYVVQSAVFIAMCIAVKKFRPVYLTAYFTCLFYGAVLDLWRLLPFFNETVTPPGSQPFPMRVALFAVGMALTSLSVAILYRSYLYPQVYDFAVKTVSRHYSLDLVTFKRCFDAGCLAAAVILVLCFFGKELSAFSLDTFIKDGFQFHGIGIATVIMTYCNGILIERFGIAFDRRFNITPRFPKAEEYFMR